MVDLVQNQIVEWGDPRLQDRVDSRLGQQLDICGEWGISEWVCGSSGAKEKEREGASEPIRRATAQKAESAVGGGGEELCWQSFGVLDDTKSR